MARPTAVISGLWRAISCSVTRRGTQSVPTWRKRCSLALVTWKNTELLPMEGDVPYTNTPSAGLPQEGAFQTDVCECEHIMTDDSDDSRDTKSFETGWHNHPYCWQASSDLWKPIWKPVSTAACKTTMLPCVWQDHQASVGFSSLRRVCGGVAVGCSDEFSASIKIAP